MKLRGFLLGLFSVGGQVLLLRELVSCRDGSFWLAYRSGHRSFSWWATYIQLQPGFAISAGYIPYSLNDYGRAIISPGYQ
jgi:hypothetical protein